MTRQAFVCSHTHWDREWYGSFQQFRLRLVRLIDHLLDLLEENPEYRCFNLDGQTVVLEDYLEIRPENRGRLRELIRSGRISVGPWYILPDEFLAGGEATIRNLTRGIRIGRSFGRCSRTGYLPDMFGHISQMPQILRGVGIDTAMVWRGLTGPDLKTEFFWESPDGSRVFTVRIPEYSGYCNAAFFWASLPEKTRRRLKPQREPHELITDDPDAVAEALRDVLEYCEEHSGARSFLLLNGIDHMQAQPELPALLKKAGEEIDDTAFIHATFDEYFDRVQLELEGDDLQVRRGELKDTAWHRGGNIVLPNILSSRVYQKISNARCQVELAFWAEPTGILARAAEGTNLLAFIDRGWQWLIQNHPHDSIGGCSADPVHDQMDTRFSWALELGRESTLNHLWDLSRAVDTSACTSEEQALLVINPLPWTRSGAVRAIVDLPETYLQGLNLEGFEYHRRDVTFGLRHLRVTDANGSEIAHQVEDVRLVTEGKSYLPRFAPVETVARVELLMELEEVPALGYRMVRVAPDPVRKLEPGNLVTGPQTLENEWLRVTVDPAGTLEVTDKRTGRVWPGLALLEDGGESGDGYNYSPPRWDEVFTTGSSSAEVAVVSRGPTSAALEIRREWNLPVSLDSTRQRRSRETAPLNIVTRVELRRAEPFIRLRIGVNNTHRDHRLRMLFPNWIKTDRCFADSQFDLLYRRIQIPQPPRDVWIEDQPRQYPVQTYCGVTDGKEGLAVLVDGLHEFEALDRPDRAVAITLLRAVRWLGAGGEGNTMFTGAGPMMETPGGQCLRPLEMDLAIVPFQGNPARAGLPRLALEWQVGFRGFLSDPHPGRLPNILSLARLEGDPRILVSAIKAGASEPEATVIRFWNPTGEDLTGTLELATRVRDAWWTDFLEEENDSASITDNRIQIQLASHQIRTLFLHLEPI